VFGLPGKIDITSLRQLKRVRRGASDVVALRRCMVRGHWRRAGKSWKDSRPRWIKPHWRGPSGAAIVEREYRLKEPEVAAGGAGPPLAVPDPRV